MKEEIENHIQHLKEGDEQAFRHIYEATKDEVTRTAAFLANRPSDVSDIVSEVYVELIRSIGSYNEKLPFRQWLYGLTARQTANWNRKVWRYFRTAEKEKRYLSTPDAKIPEEIWLRKERRLELTDGVRKLSGKLRAVVVLRYYHEMSFPEIAETLALPIGTVKSRHDQALKKLKVWTETKTEEKESKAHVY
ncbi:sigma-70 family RNA polymerase sigma factor [Paenibacillus sp.]|uniref:sigma-70 family RNA polymerase sigma factor n=1 Tax=Paenibacillus sp. TaxID=58172 RepID=UPI002810BB06|nr:sigma-70 family RNA polymerase sigma factor [Paenibacillus sp.]